MTITRSQVQKLAGLLEELDELREMNAQIARALTGEIHSVRVTIDSGATGNLRYDMSLENFLPVIGMVQSQFTQRLDKIQSEALMFGLVDEKPENPVDQPPEP